MAMLLIEELHGISLIEDVVEDPPHVTLTKHMEDMEYCHDYCNDDDQICILDLLKEQTIIDPCKETYDKVSVVYDDTPLYGDEGLERFTPCNIFETKTIKEDCYEHPRRLRSLLWV